MASKSQYYDLDTDERAAFLEACVAPRFTDKQIDSWVFRNQVWDFTRMTNLSKAVRENLAMQTVIQAGTRGKRLKSKDKTVKLLVKYGPRNHTECVSIPDGRRLTFCLSTMVGCPGKCLFCASGRHGLQRRLTRAEILGQYLLLTAESKRYPTNVVLMGMGEPLLSYEASIGFLKMLNDPERGDLGARRITVSTIGIPEGIVRLADEGLQFELAFSLHHPSAEERKRLIPIAEKYPLEGILEALLYYRRKVNRKVTFEYCLLRGENDSISCAQRTAELARRVNAKVNLIPFNEYGTRFETPAPETVERFRDIVDKAGVTVTVRKGRGADINAACGQLRLAMKKK